MDQVAMRIEDVSPSQLPPSSAIVWLDAAGNTWCTISSKSVTIRGQNYDLPGGTLSFEKSAASREQLLSLLKKQHQLWKPGNEEGLIAYAKAMKT